MAVRRFGLDALLATADSPSRRERAPRGLPDPHPKPLAEE